jgi:putative membrane protein
MIVWNQSGRRIATSAVLFLLGAVGCQHLHTIGTQSITPEPLTDANIGAIFLAANNTDVSYAKVALAPGQTSTAPVLAFASRMLADHSGLNQAATEVLGRVGILPEDNTVSLDFRDESAAKRDTLRERKGALFDSTYMANEVRYHTRLLSTLDNVLIPSAKNSDLKSLLSGVRPAVAAHLEHAQRVQAGLGK